MENQTFFQVKLHSDPNDVNSIFHPENLKKLLEDSSEHTQLNQILSNITNAQPFELYKKDYVDGNEEGEHQIGGQ